MEAQRQQSGSPKNQRPAVRFEVHPNLSKNIHEPTTREHTSDSQQHIGECPERMRCGETPAHEANATPHGDGDKGCHGLSCRYWGGSLSVALLVAITDDNHPNHTRFEKNCNWQN
jgi:hypothetical protein